MRSCAARFACADNSQEVAPRATWVEARSSRPLTGSLVKASPQMRNWSPMSRSRPLIWKAGHGSALPVDRD